MDTKQPEQDIFLKNGVNNRYNAILDRLITSAGLSKQDLARKLGISRTYVSQIVHGHLEAPLRIKLLISKELGVDSRVLWPDFENVEDLKK